MARRSGTLSHLAVRNYVAADQSGGGEGLLFPLFIGTSGNCGSCKCGGGEGFKALGGTGLLFPGKKSAKGGEDNYDGIRRRNAENFSGIKEASRHRRVYRRSHCLHCL